MKRVLSEARNAARKGGRFIKMDRCENCLRPGTLEPNYARFEGPSQTSEFGIERICLRCSKKTWERA